MFGRDAHTVYLEKLGLTAPLIETEAMTLGNWLEDPIARYWSEQTGLPVRRHRATIRHATKPYLFTHVDRVVADRPQKVGELTQILEVKNAGVFRASDFGERDSDQVPPGYLLQAVHTMVVLPDVERVYLAALLGGTGFRKFVIERDPELVAEVEAQETAFWTEHVVPKVPPPLDGSEGASKTLATLYPQDDGTEIEADELLSEIVRKYLAARATSKDADARMTAWAQQIQDRMREATTVVGDGFRVSWKSAKGSVSWKGVAEELAEDFALQTELIEALERHRGAGSRRFTVTEKEPSA